MSRDVRVEPDPRDASGPASQASTIDLAPRLARFAALRLLLLTLFLGVVAFVYLRGQTGGDSAMIAFLAVAVAYALSAIYAGFLRAQRLLPVVANLQLVTDQLVWTAFVYVTGGVTSGGVSLYGLTCLVGAATLGARGGAVALVSGVVAYGTMAVLLLERILPVPSDQALGVYVATYRDAAFPMVANVLALTLVTVLASTLADRLQRAGGALAVAEERAERVEHLAGLGRLAAGLAHEIRNPLGSIAGSVELLSSSPGLTDEDRRLCDIVQREAARLNDLVGDMLELARPREPVLQEVEMVRVTRDIVTLAASSGRGADVVVEYDGPPELVLRCDASQIRQLLWNLVRNAVQASSGGGTVQVFLSREPGLGAVLSVADQGKGIPEDSHDTIFDAFFTTRTQGTGVGLAVVKRIVDSHGFRIEVASDPGEGAVFMVTVPERSVVDRPPSLVPGESEAPD